MQFVGNIQCILRSILVFHSEHSLSFFVIIPRALLRLMQKTGFCEDLALHVIVELFWSTRCVCLALKRAIKERRGGKKTSHGLIYSLCELCLCETSNKPLCHSLLISLSVNTQPGKQSASVCLQSAPGFSSACCSGFQLAVPRLL